MLGLIEFNGLTLFSEDGRQRLIWFTPAPGTDNTAKLDLLVEVPALSPREVVVKTLTAVLEPLDTSHVISNLRITVDGDNATAHCYVQAQHFRSGDGPRPDRTRHALLANRMDVTLARDGSQWRIDHLTIDNMWFDGDPTVLAPA